MGRASRAKKERRAAKPIGIDPHEFCSDCGGHFSVVGTLHFGGGDEGFCEPCVDKWMADARKEWAKMDAELAHLWDG